MKITPNARLPNKIYGAKAKDRAKLWNRLLKKVDDTTLVSIIESLLYSPYQVKNKAWQFAGVALNELTIRPWANNNDIEFFREALREKSSLCFSSRSYSLETGGLKTDRGIVHPYAYSEVAKKVRDLWEERSSNKSLNAFINEDIPPEDKEFLKTHTIRYFTPEELEDYRVSFDKGKVKIGNKTPKDDDWYMFVLDAKKKHLYAAKKIKGIIHHTSLTQGLPVACAGEFKLRKGKITRISLRSGHYRPTVDVHGKACREFLSKEENLGAQMSFLEIERYDE